jgi:hypothetical protein
MHPVGCLVGGYWLPDLTATTAGVTPACAKGVKDMIVANNIAAVIHYVKVDEIRHGDVLLTTLASDQRIVFSDKVDEVWEYDESHYVRFFDGSTGCYNRNETVSVMRFTEGEDEEDEE